MIKLNKKTLYLIDLIYIAVPILLFLFGWTKWYIAICCSAVLIGCYWRMYRSFTEEKEESIAVKPIVFIGVVFVLMLFGYAFGWGRWTAQPYDWEKHNTLLSDLTKRSWPVYYTNGSEHSMLTYYIAQYLVPAFVGKATGSFRVTERMIYVWNEIGILLIWLQLIRALKIEKGYKQVLSSIFFLMFGLPLALAKKFAINFTTFDIFQDKDNPSWFVLDDDRLIHLQYSENFTLLNWVFPQVIVIWLVTLLFFEHKDKLRYYIPLMLPCMLYGILSFIGMVIFAAAYAVFLLVRDKKFADWLKSVLSPENILCMATLGSVLLLYYYGNMISEKPDALGFKIMPYKGGLIGIYFLFVIFNVLPYGLSLFKWYKRDVLYWVSFISLLIFPIFRMGMYNDLMMRASIPALFLFMYYIMEIFNRYINIPQSDPSVKGKKLSKEEQKLQLKKDMQDIKKKLLKVPVQVYILIVFVLIGAHYPHRCFTRIMLADNISECGKLRSWGSAEKYANRGIKDKQDQVYNYFSYDIDDNLFYKYISRVKDE
ncbi:MAG: hypothetical protein IJM38_09680 [Ruminococcus sp.]|nr:hypothetical protein [Ruminococcus sp.]